MTAPIAPAVKTPGPEELAMITIEFLDRIDLNAKEVPAFVEVQMWLSKLATPPAPPAEPVDDESAEPVAAEPSGE